MIDVTPLRELAIDLGKIIGPGGIMEHHLEWNHKWFSALISYISLLADNIENNMISLSLAIDTMNQLQRQVAREMEEHTAPVVPEIVFWVGGAAFKLMQGISPCHIVTCADRSPS